MPDPTPAAAPEPTPAPEPHLKQETSEVILPPDSSSTSKNLSDMFSRIEAAKSEGKSAKDAIQPPTAPTEPEAQPNDKPEEKPNEKISQSNEQQEKRPEGENPRANLLDSLQKREGGKKDTEEVKVPEEELKVLPTDKPKVAQRIQAFLRKIEEVKAEATSTKAEAQEKATKLAELEKKLAEQKTVDPATEEKIKKQLDELTMYRRRYDLEKDPEIKSKFDSRIEAAEDQITQALVNRNASEVLLKTIKAEGGWAKFSQSGRLYSVNDGEGGTKNITAAELAETILQNLPPGERIQVEAAAMDQYQTKREKERFFKQEQENAAAYFKKQEEEQQKQQQESEKILSEQRKKIEEFETKTLEADWMKDKPLDPKATAAEKAAIEEHNKYNAQMRSLFKKAIRTHDLEGLMEIMTDSVRYYDERRSSMNLRKENEKLKADLTAKQAELDRFKGATKTTRGGSILTIPPVEKNWQQDRPRDISDVFDRMERGETMIVTRDEE